PVRSLFSSTDPRPPSSTPFPYTTLFRSGVSSPEALTPWTEQVAELGAALVGARRETLALLSPAFAERAGELGLAGGALVYDVDRSEEHTSELQSRGHLVCRLLLEKKKQY